MSVGKRIAIAVGASVLTVSGLFALLVVYPVPAIGRALIFVGFPLGWLIFKATPDGFIHELAPQGGPDAVGWAIALGTFLTWLIVLFGVWFVVIGRMRSNSTPHTDARASAVPNQPPSARAGERGR